MQHTSVAQFLEDLRTQGLSLENPVDHGAIAEAFERLISRSILN